LLGPYTALEIALLVGGVIVVTLGYHTLEKKTRHGYTYSRTAPVSVCELNSADTWRSLAYRLANDHE